MKRYLSVFEMIARSSIYKVLLIIAGMVMAQAIVFYQKVMAGGMYSLESYIYECDFGISFRIAYVLITIVIVLPGMNLGSVQSYTLQRLRIKESKVFWLQVLYNFVAYVLLWGIQLMTLLTMAVFHYQKFADNGIWNNQTLFLAFYKSEFMHTMLPLEDGLGWFVLVSMGLISALTAAEFTKRQRCGKFGFELVVVVIITLIGITRNIGDVPQYLMITYAIVYLVLGTRWFSNKLGGEQS